MLISVFIIATMGITILVMNPENSNRWLGLSVFCVAIGDLGQYLSRNLLPYLKISSPSNILLSIAYYIAWYPLIIFAIANTNFFKMTRHKLFIQFILAIPGAMLFVLYPSFPEFNPNRIFLLCVALFYFLSINGIFFVTSLKVTNLFIKRQLLLTISLITPISVYFIITNYILPCGKIVLPTYYDNVAMALFFGGVIVFTNRYGLWGIKVHFDKMALENSMNTVNRGTAILNHKIKNQLLITNACINNLADLHPDPKTKEILLFIENANKNILEVINKITEQTQEIEMNEEKVDIGIILEKSLITALLIAENQGKNIEIIKYFEPNIYVLGDHLYLQEVFFNIFNNAFEAINNEGKIEIFIIEKENNWIISISDNGIGIAKANIARVFEPFFSTKTTINNLGLGLSYCYQIISGHGWKISIESRENIGTTVNIILPKKE